MKTVGSKVVDQRREHVVEGDTGVQAQDQVVDKDECGHGETGLCLLSWLGVLGLCDNTRDLADLGVEEADRERISTCNSQGCLPVHEEVVVFRERDPGGHWTCFHCECVNLGARSALRVPGRRTMIVLTKNAR